MIAYLIVFLGAGIGGMLRHGVNVAALRVLGSAFPYGTVAVNIAGSLLMGVFVGWFALRSDVGQGWRLFLTTGMLGGFTTFSTFSLDTALLWERGNLVTTLTYFLVSVGFGILGLFAGMALMRQVG